MNYSFDCTFETFFSNFKDHEKFGFKSYLHVFSNQTFCRYLLEFVNPLPEGFRVGPPRTSNFLEQQLTQRLEGNSRNPGRFRDV